MITTIPRDLYEVMGKMLDLIPTGQIKLRADLEKARQTVAYAAPELMPGLWTRVGEILATHLGTPILLTGWAKDVATIYLGAT